MRFLIPALLLAVLILPGCVGARFEDGALVTEVSPPASLARVQKSEKAAKQYADELAETMQTLAEGQAALAKAIGDAAVETAAKEAQLRAELAEKERQMTQDQFDIEDLATNQWFWTILGALGLAEVGRRKIKAAKAELPDDYEVVDEA